MKVLMNEKIDFQGEFGLSLFDLANVIHSIF